MYGARMVTYGYIYVLLLYSTVISISISILSMAWWAATRTGGRRGGIPGGRRTGGHPGGRTPRRALHGTNGNICLRYGERGIRRSGSPNAEAAPPSEARGLKAHRACFGQPTAPWAPTKFPPAKHPTTPAAATRRPRRLGLITTTQRARDTPRQSALYLRLWLHTPHGRRMGRGYGRLPRHVCAMHLKL
jgi:hypothetical protein